MDGVDLILNEDRGIERYFRRVDYSPALSIP